MIAVSEGFRNFHAEWKGRVAGEQHSLRTRDFYLETPRDLSGFDILPDFIANHGEEWAVEYAAIFEREASIAARVDLDELLRFRMIFDRHLANLSSAQFDASFIASSDERSLFLIYHRIPPIRAVGALNKAKNASMDLVIGHAEGQFGHREMALISALSTLYMIEANHIMRVYMLFERLITPVDRRYRFSDIDGVLPVDYQPPTRNAQLSLPDKDDQGSVELF